MIKCHMHLFEKNMSDPSPSRINHPQGIFVYSTPSSVYATCDGGHYLIN